MNFDNKNRLTGLLGTIAVHLFLLVCFMFLKLDEVKHRHEELIAIEFFEEEYKTVEELIEESRPKNVQIEQLSEKTLSNVISNTAAELEEEISTEDYEKQVMEELGMDEINPHYDNSLEPIEETPQEEAPKGRFTKNFGNTRIEINVPNRSGIYIHRPNYMCQGGGTIVLNIEVNPQGRVVSAVVQSSDTDETCVLETAINSAKRSTFNRDASAPNKVSGTIQYIFVAQ